MRSFCLFITGGMLHFSLLLIPLHAQLTSNQDAAQLQAALKKLNVLGSVLYVAAHPDDENTAMLAYSANHRYFRTGYLALTRGDGGQNLIGSEQSELLGIIRTQELLAARRIDGAEQFFTRAIDFGYTKSPGETFTFWDREKVLSDVVWVIRNFKPDVIVTRFPATGEGGHGQHTASAILAQEAFKLAGDPTKFPEQLKYTDVWRPQRIYWNAWLPVLQERKADLTQLIRIDVGEYDPLLGKSYTELAAESRSMHKSQGFGVSAQRAENINYFQWIGGDSASHDLFDGVNTTWSRVKDGEKVGPLLQEAYRAFDPENPSASIPPLLAAYQQMNALPQNIWVKQKQNELNHVIRACAGLWMEAIATDYGAAPGSSVKITSSIINRSNFPVTLERINYPFQARDTLSYVLLKKGKPSGSAVIVEIPMETAISQPYWLSKEPSKGMFSFDDPIMAGMAENHSELSVEYVLKFDGVTIPFQVPVQYRWTDPVKGELYRPFDILPPVTMNVNEKVLLFTKNDPRSVTLTLKSGKPNVNGELTLRLPAGWKSSPEKITFSLGNKYDEAKAVFFIEPPASNEEGYFTAEALVDGKRYSRGLQTIQYDHIPTQVIFPETRTKLVRLNIQNRSQNLGYIMGSGDMIPEYLRQLGIQVTLLSDDDLERGQFEGYDAIIAGIRAYNTRPRLKFAQDKLMRYVENGGTFIVQYNTPRGLATENLGPYPFKISNDRVTEEDAAVKITLPEHALVRFPNTISDRDFSGWVQERGLYFANTWDPKYETVFTAHDNGEKDISGGMLFARYGKGVFIYTGYAWFRQIPAGVPGAYKLFLNMISAGKEKKN